MQDFLEQLKELNQTNQDLFQMQAQTNKIQLQMIQQLIALSRQVDGLARRCDLLYQQMAQLGQIMVEEEDPGMGFVPPMLPNHGSAPSLGRFVGEKVDQFFYGTNGGSGRHRRH